MAVYNGEQYLEEQINSIINQDYSNWRLLIHDDGSSDRSVSIIKKFVKKDSRILFDSDKSQKHLGIQNSFLQLLRISSADYYMFSDQDDVWDTDKILKTLKKIQLVDTGTEPVVVHTNLRVADDQLNTLNPDSKNGYKAVQFKSIVLANNVTGCTVMMNERAKELMLISYSHVDPSKVIMHDWWLALIASSMGKLVFLDSPLISYRQHAGNAVGYAKKKNIVLRLIGRFTHHRRFEIMKTINQAVAFGNVFADQLPKNDSDICNYLSRIQNNKMLRIKAAHEANALDLHMPFPKMEFNWKVFILLPNALRNLLY